MFQSQIIGYARSCYPDKFGTPRQPGLASKARAFLQLTTDVQPDLSLEGLENYSHLWVMFVFHKNSAARFHAKVHPPRMDGETRGVFATRSPHRPNPIGLSLVEIESIEKDGVWVRGVDFIDGTPLLDLKPYLPEIESRPDAKAPNLKPDEYAIQMEWRSEDLDFVRSYESSSGHKNVRELIEDTLRLDPRPLVYRGYEGRQSPYRQTHAVRVYEVDVHFQFVAKDQIRIEKVVNWA